MVNMKKTPVKIKPKIKEPKIAIPDQKSFQRALEKGWEARERAQQELKTNRSASDQDLNLLLQQCGSNSP